MRGIDSCMQCLADEPYTIIRVAKSIMVLSEQCPERAVPRRMKMTDSEVRLWIQCELKSQDMSRSALLRNLRSRGMAVEQVRFASLYAEVKGAGRGR